MSRGSPTLIRWAVTKVKTPSPPLKRDVLYEEEETSEGLQDEIVNHLENLKKKFGHYFSNDESSEQDWIRNHFLFNLDAMDDSNMQEMSS